VSPNARAARLFLVSFAAVLATSSIGCGVVATEKPLYDARETVFDPQLLGIWSVPNANGEPGILIIARGPAKEYRFSSMPLQPAGSSSNSADMNLVRLGKYEYFFLKAPQFSGTLLFPAYRVRVIGREMRISLLNEPQFAEELKRYPGMLAYTEQPLETLRPVETQPSATTRPVAASQPTTRPTATNVVLTDRPEKIRRLLIQHEEDPNWFAEILVLHRLTPPVRQ
jgi:hypothetical protein